MSSKAIVVENVSKLYRLGEVGSGMLTQDLNRWWHSIRGKEDPYLKVGQKNDRTSGQHSDFVWALNNIDFTIEQGEVVGFIGSNGAGKSTLLKILSRITSPSTGVVKIKGKMSSLLEVGTGFHPELTGRENIYLNGTILGMRRAEVSIKLEQIVEFSGVRKYLDTPVKRYSSGMVVRLGFAVAAHLEPDILVVDEVLAVGDADFQEKCISKMNEVGKQGKTVLFVSHNLTSVQQLCNRGILLENGEMTLDSDVQTVVNHYLKRNVFEGKKEFDLASITNRKGTGTICFKHLKLDFISGGNMLSIGQDLKIQLQIEAFELRPNLAIAIHLWEMDESIIANIENRDSGFSIQPFVGEKTFEIVFQDLRLYPGIYKLGFWIGSANGGETYDQLLYCAEFIIDENSSLVKRNLRRSSGLFYFTPQWKEI